MSIAVAVFLLAGLPSQDPTQNSSEDVYRTAVQARLAGDADRAAQLLEAVVAADPRNADAQVQLGLAQLARDRLPAAEAAFRAALAIAPAYADARIGLARVAQRRGERAAALRELQSVDAANEEAATLRNQLESEPALSRWRLDLDGSYSRLSGPQPDWKEAVVQLRFSPSTAMVLGGRIEYARRFGVDDVYGELSAERSIAPGINAYLAVGAAIDPDYRPEWQLRAGGSARLHGGSYATILTLDARQARFAAGDVQGITPGIEQYFGGRLWVTGRWINQFDERGTHRSGFLVRGDLMPVDPVRLFVGYSDAPDTDEGTVVDVRSVFGGVSYDLNPRMTLRLSLAHEDRATGADRTQFGLGFGIRL